MLKNFMNVVINQTRNYAFKSKLKIKWVRPVPTPVYTPEKSGDLDPAVQIPLSELGFFFKKAQGIKDADEDVLKLCSVGFLGKKEENRVKRWKVMETVKRHQYDFTSMEVRIANLTERIRLLQETVENHPHDKLSKHLCYMLMQKRQKFLKYMRRWDYKRFEWLLEKLNIVYKASPGNNMRITRRESIAKLCDIHCDTLKSNKLAEYKEQLMREREALLREYNIDPSTRPLQAPKWASGDIKSQIEAIQPVANHSRDHKAEKK